MAEKRYDGENVQKFLKELFAKAGYSPAHAKILAESLTTTSLRGVDSHGIRLTPHYINSVKIRRINRSPKFKFTQKGSGVSILDANHGHGIVAGFEAMKRAMVLAKKTGIGAVAVKNSTHFGAAALYSLLAAKNNMIGISFTHAESLVAPYGGRKAFLGTNPICFAAPCDGEEPFCLDMATSTVTRNKVLNYKENGKLLEANWAVNEQGEITTDPNQAAALFPFGGYKGYGLGLMIEILCSILTGMPFGPQIAPMLPLSKEHRKLGHFFIAIDIKRFQSVPTFKRRLKQMLETLRHSPTANGFNNIFASGDVEKNYFVDRSNAGIPVSDALQTSFANLAEQFGVKAL